MNTTTKTPMPNPTGGNAQVNDRSIGLRACDLERIGITVFFASAHTDAKKAEYLENAHLVADMHAMHMILRMLCAGVARIERNDVTTRFVFEHEGRFSSSYVECGWAEIVNHIGWDTCRAALWEG